VDKDNQGKTELQTIAPHSLVHSDFFSKNKKFNHPFKPVVVGGVRIISGQCLPF
jgi:hypothetical protein